MVTMDRNAEFQDGFETGKRGAEQERDKFKARYLAEIKENAAARQRYLETIGFLEGQLAAAKSSHDGQKRNTMAFLRERDAAVAGLKKIRSLADNPQDDGRAIVEIYAVAAEAIVAAT